MCCTYMCQITGLPGGRSPTRCQSVQDHGKMSTIEDWEPEPEKPSSQSLSLRDPSQEKKSAKKEGNVLLGPQWGAVQQVTLVAV